MGDVTAPADGPEEGAAVWAEAGAAATGAGWVAIAAMAPARATRMRAPFCSTSISVKPVSARRSDKARIASVSMPGLLLDRRDLRSFFSFMSFFLWARSAEPPRHRSPADRN